MDVKRPLVIAVVVAALMAGLVTAAAASTPPEVVAEICGGLFGGVFGAPNGEPLGICQWNMAIIHASDDGSYALATGKGVTVAMLDTGVDFNHPDIFPNLDVDRSCSFIFDDTPTADSSEISNGDCTNKTAVQDMNGHGTFTASIVAAPVNEIGIAGVAPEATIVSLKVCTVGGLCFVDSVAAALRYAGDHELDIVNMSLFADPYLYYCKSEKEQRAMLKELEAAARYAQQRGVLIVAAAGNMTDDLQHPGIDAISPDWPPDSAEVRYVKNNCRVAPAELAGVLTVSATGPVGYPGYETWIASYSTVGMSRVDIAAPGGDWGAASGTLQDMVLGAFSSTDITGFWEFVESLGDETPGWATEQGDGRYMFLAGTSAAAPHVAGVAALVKEVHPNWGPEAIKAAVERSAQQLGCPDNWEPVGPWDQRERCYGQSGRTSFFGHGLLDAEQAARLK